MYAVRENMEKSGGNEKNLLRSEKSHGNLFQPILQFSGKHASDPTKGFRTCSKNLH